MNSSKLVFQKIYFDLLNNGKLRAPRGLKTLELEDYNYKIPPYVRFTSFKSRNFNLNYIKKEFLWYLKGDKYDISIIKHAKLWKSLINKDGSINSNYGQYIFSKTNQFNNVIKILTKDKDSRRASIVILNSNHLLSKTNDYPCTYSINFRIRDNFLNMSVAMRSQDAIFGMTNDVAAFSFIHEMVYTVLKAVYSELKYGMYHHYVNSFHVYERHFNMLKRLVRDTEEYEEVRCPKILNKDEVKFLIEYNFDNIPNNYKFTK